MKIKLLSLWAWFEVIGVIVSWTLMISILYVFAAPFTKVRRFMGWWFRKGGHAIIALNPMWKVAISGYHPPRWLPAHVVVSNHQSIADIPVISNLHWEMKWLSKERNFELPFFGWMMKMVGDVPLVRGEKGSTTAAMKRCRWYLDHDMPVMIFPEGTRSNDGTIKPFKDGAFRLAIESGCPILPIVVAGSRHCIPKHTWVFGSRTDMKVHVLEPIPVEGLTLEDVEGLKAQVRDQITEHFDRLMATLNNPAEAEALVARTV